MLGGAAIAASFWLGTGVLFLLGDLGWTRSLRGLLIGSLLVLVLGFVDDLVELDPYTKLGGQIVAATVLVLHGLSLTLFVGQNLLTMALTVGWIVLLTNSFNLLDNMNGLCTGVGAIASGMLGLVAAYQSQWNLVLLVLLFSAVLLGFLPFNAGRATIFLGDAGSGFIGFLLGTLSLMTTYASEAPLEKLPVIVPLIIFSVPFYDTFTVILFRLRHGHPIMKGDNRHFSHRLTRLGMSEGSAVGLICLLTLSTGLIGSMLPRVELIPALVIVLHTVLIMAVILVLEGASMQRADESTDSR